MQTTLANMQISEDRETSTPSSSPTFGLRLYVIIGIVALLLFLAINLPIVRLIYISTGSIGDTAFLSAFIGGPLLIADILLFRWLKDSFQVHRWTAQRLTAERQRSAARKGDSAS